MIRRKRTIAGKFALTAFATLALAACSESAPAPANEANPPLFEITNANGEIEGWMLGTIHALPDGVDWRNDAVASAIEQADYTYVEIAGLSNREAIAATFTRLATTPGLPDLHSRVGADNRLALTKLILEAGFEPDDFASTETWAAALMLSRVAATGDSANGVDKAIIRDFAGREVREFEGAELQLSIFDQLPETDQRDLLEGVIEEIARSDIDPGALADAWAAGDMAALEKTTTTGIMADPELRDALIIERNKRWSRLLVQALKDGAKPLVAVGAGHLVGDDSMPQLLAENGYTVTRVTR